MKRRSTISLKDEHKKAHSVSFVENTGFEPVDFPNVCGTL